MIHFRLVAACFYFLLFCGFFATAIVAHRRIRFLHPRPLFLGLFLLACYGLTNLLEHSAAFHEIHWLSTGFLHNFFHDFVFPVIGSLLTIVALIVEAISRSRHIKDISYRMQELLNSIILSSPEAVVGYDLDNRVTVWNRAAARLFGYSREEVLGETIWDRLAAPEMRERLSEMWDHLKTQGPLEDYPLSMFTRDGRPLQLRVSSFPIRSDDGQIIGRASIYRQCEEEERLAFLVGSFRSHLDVRRGFRDFVEQLRRIVPHDEAMVFTRNESDDGLRLYVSTGSNPSLDLLPISFSPTSVLMQGLQGNISRVGVRTQLMDSEEGKIFDIAGMESCLVLPLQESHGVVGVLALFSSRQHAFSKEHERTLRLLAQHLGPAVSSMQLFSALSDFEAESEEPSEEAEDGVALVSVNDGTLVSANNSFRAMLNLASDEISTYRLMDFMPSDKQHRAEQILASAKKGETLTDEIQLKSTDHHLVWAEVRGKMLHFAGRAHVLLMFHDITQQRRLYDEVSEREQRYRFLLESFGRISDIVYMVDGEGHYLYCNESFEKTLKYPVEDFAAEPTKYLTDNPLNQYITEKRQFQDEEREGTPFLMELNDADRKRVLFEVTEKRLPLQDGTTGLIGVMRNLTERRFLEERILQDNQELTLLNARLEKLAKVKDEFLANTSHELRTPLNSILGFTSLILEEDSLSSDEVHEFLGSIHCSARHLLTLINDILDIAKIESGEVQLQARPIPLGEVLAEVQSISHVQAREQNLDLVFEPVPPNVPDLMGDREKVTRILLNLVSNSIKFTPQGRITVRPNYECHPGYVQIDVRDTGIGIEEDMLESVFEAFRQVDGSSTRSYAGTGLGLTICRQLVEVMGGTIWIQSDGKDKGTTVSFTVPLADNEFQEEPAESSVYVSDRNEVRPSV